MRVGFNMRQQAIGACYAKALRLNSSSIADISVGKVTHHTLSYLGGWRVSVVRVFQL